MGCVKNLCLPEPGRLGLGDVRPEIAALLDALAERKAPVATVGLAEALLARHQGRALDVKPTWVPVREVVADEERRTLFTPGFMAVGISRRWRRGWIASSSTLRAGSASTPDSGSRELVW